MCQQRADGETQGQKSRKNRSGWKSRIQPEVGMRTQCATRMNLRGGCGEVWEKRKSSGRQRGVAMWTPWLNKTDDERREGGRWRWKSTGYAKSVEMNCRGAGDAGTDEAGRWRSRRSERRGEESSPEWQRITGSSLWIKSPSSYPHATTNDLTLVLLPSVSPSVRLFVLRSSSLVTPPSTSFHLLPWYPRRGASFT